MTGQNLKSVFGDGGFNPAEYMKPEKTFNFPSNPILVIKEEIEKLGFNPGPLYVDGQTHRFNTKPGRPNSNAGWYRIEELDNGFLTCGIGCHIQDVHYNVHSLRRNLSPIEQVKYDEVKRKNAEKAKKIKEESYKYAALDALSMWENSIPADTNHQYLKDKGLKSNHGIRINSSGELIIKRRDESGKIWSLERIKQNGDKLSTPGGRKKDTFHIIDGDESLGIVYIAEGFATGATIKEETGSTVAISFGKNSLLYTAISIKNLYPDKRIIIAADNDKDGKGEQKANEAAQKIGADIVVSPVSDLGDGKIGTDFNDYRLSGGDVKESLGVESACKILKTYSVDDLDIEYTPPDELVQDVIVKGRTCMIYGNSHAGKTFMAIAMCRSVVTGNDFFGKKVEKGSVLYLAVESCGSVEERMKTLRAYYPDDDFTNLIVSPVDLNFYDEKKNDAETVIRAVKELNNTLDNKISLVIGDTLAQMSAGANENSNEMELVMKKFSKIAIETGAASLVIHHNGKNKEMGPRGHSGMGAHVDASILVEDKGEVKQATIEKQRDLGTKGMEMFYKLSIIERGIGKFGDMKSSCVAIDASEEEIDACAKRESIFKKKEQEAAYRTFRDAWISVKCPDMNGLPYINRNPFKTFLLENKIYNKDSSANKALQKSGKIVGPLIECGAIDRAYDGEMVIIQNSELVSQLMLIRQSIICG